MGIEPVLRDKLEGEFADVVFTAAPSGNSDYVGEVEYALERWNGTGGFVFTSSGGVFAEGDGALVTETGDVLPREGNPRAAALLDAEDKVRARGGAVVRLSGLYTHTRGPHSFWLRAGKVKGRPDGLINMVHYDDAASLVVAVLGTFPGQGAGQTFLGNDDAVLTREEIVAAARQHPDYRDAPPVEFGPKEGPLGRRYDNSWTRNMTGWVPKYKSMSAFWAQEAATDSTRV